MIKLTINATKMSADGTLVPDSRDVVVYNEPSEIGMLQWCRIVDAIGAFPGWFLSINDGTKGQQEIQQEIATWSHSRWAQYYWILAQIVAMFSDTDAETFLYLDMSKVGDEPDEVTSIMYSTVKSLYTNILDNFMGYEPQKRTQFEYKGDTYVLPQNVQQVGGDPLPWGNIKTIEAIEALQAEQVFSTLDDEGNFIMEDATYNIHIAIVAATCRKMVNGEAERIPVAGPEWDDFFARRMGHFSDLPYDIAKDVFFFIYDSKKPSGSTLWFRLFSKVMVLENED